MKKLLLLFALLSCMVFANAETSTLELAKVTTGQSSFTQSTGNVSWTFVLTGSTYFGWDNTKGLQLGKASEHCTAITATSTGLADYTISKVTVNTSGASQINATLSVKVGETTFLNGTSETYKLTTTATNAVFTGSASGEVTLNYTNSSAKAVYIKSITVEYTAADDNRETATLTWSASTAETTLGATDFTAPTLTVNPVAAASEVVYASSNESVAKFENGELSILAAGKTTITAAISDSEKYQDAKASYTLKVVDPNATQFELVTDVSTLVNGQQIIIVSNNKALSTDQKSNNRGATSVTLADGGIVPGDDVQIITLGKDKDLYTFNVGTGYLYAASSKSNYLRTQDNIDKNATATITIAASGNATIKFQGTNTRNVLRYNSTSRLFSCYESGQEDVQIYASNDSYTGTISLGAAYSYDEYSKANVLTFTATISKNGNPIAEVEKANYEVLLDGVSLGHAGEVISHFAYNKDGKFSLKNGDRTIALDVEWPNLDIAPKIAKVKYIKSEDGIYDAIYYIEPATVPAGYNWLVNVNTDGAIFGWDNEGAACKFENVGADAADAPAAINANIAFPFAVSKATRAGEYDIVVYSAEAVDLATNEIEAPNDNNTSGVADVAVDQNAAAEYYNLQGVRVNGDLTPGLYIRRQGNQATKVVVR